MSPRPLGPPEVDEETPMEALQRQVKAQEEVLRDYKETIDNQRKKLAEAAELIRRERDIVRERDAAKYELEMYRTIVKGWPKGKKLIKQLNRPYDYY